MKAVSLFRRVFGGGSRSSSSTYVLCREAFACKFSYTQPYAQASAAEVCASTAKTGRAVVFRTIWRLHSYSMRFCRSRSWRLSRACGSAISTAELPFSHRLKQRRCLSAVSPSPAQRAASLAAHSHVIAFGPRWPTKSARSRRQQLRPPPIHGVLRLSHQVACSRVTMLAGSLRPHVHLMWGRLPLPTRSNMRRTVPHPSGIKLGVTA